MKMREDYLTSNWKISLTGNALYRQGYLLCYLCKWVIKFHISASTESLPFFTHFCCSHVWTEHFVIRLKRHVALVETFHSSAAY